MGSLRKILAAVDTFAGGMLEGRRRIILAAAVFVIGSAVCGIHSTTLGPFNNWDLRNYHYYTAYSLLTGRLDYDYAPAQLQTFLNPLPYVPFYLLTAKLPPVAAAFVLGAVHGLAIGFVFLLALVLFSSLAPAARIILSLLCAGIGAYGPTYVAFIGGSNADNITLIFVIAGLYLIVRAARLHGSPDKRESLRALLAGGALFGIAAGLKLVSAIFLFAAGVAVLVTGYGISRRIRATALFGAAGFAGALLSRGFWMAMLWSRFGSPLFPFFNKIFRSPYYYNRNFSDKRFLPKTIENALAMPFHFVTRAKFTNIKDIRYTIVYVLALICLIALIVRIFMALRARSKLRMPDRAGVFMLVFFVVSYVVWQTKFAIMRYAVPLELVAPMLIVLLVGYLLPWKHPRVIAILAAFISILVIMQPRSVEHKEGWASPYIDVTAPELSDPGSTLVILANDQPWSYLIPAFPPDVRFIGLYNTFSNPGVKNPHKATKEMIEIVRSHKGKIYILASNDRIEEALENVKPCGLDIQNVREKSRIVRRSRNRPDYLEKQGILPVYSKQELRAIFLWPVEMK